MTENKKKKVLLAFSGGLDTSFAVKYLSEDLGYEVHTAIANTGGFTEEELKVIADTTKRLPPRSTSPRSITTRASNIWWPAMCSATALIPSR